MLSFFSSVVFKVIRKEAVATAAAMVAIYSFFFKCLEFNVRVHKVQMNAIEFFVPFFPILLSVFC